MNSILNPLFAGLLLAASGVVSAGPSPVMVSSPCAGCHGTEGASLGEAPVIAGLTKAYFVGTMKNYRSGERFGTIMERIAKGYDDAQIEAMGKFFSGKPWPETRQTTSAAKAAAGQTLHITNGCIGCHGPNGIPAMATVPRVAGQYAGFLAQQMRDYRDESKPIPAEALLMRSMLGKLSDEDIDALAQFYASQK